MEMLVWHMAFLATLELQNNAERKIYSIYPQLKIKFPIKF